MTNQKSPTDAVKNVISRLFQVRQLWSDAAASYFEPAKFQLSVQNCITLCRSVTFILQANKHDIPGFDEWYSTHQERWRQDPIMEWAKNARNIIEKRGDLETYSQVRSEIVTGYFEGPETDWMPDVLFSSPREIYDAVPSKFFIPHVVENGTLLIERRWVDSALPTVEILEALAHVYEQLALTLINLLEYLNIPAPEGITRSKPDVMGELAMDRALYISMRDGTPRGFRIFHRKLNYLHEKHTIRRYRNAGDWKELKIAGAFRDVASIYFKRARAVMKRDGFMSFWQFFLEVQES
jgi:hypothetical protein